MDSHRKRSTLQRLSAVWPMNDNHEGPVPPGGAIVFRQHAVDDVLVDVDSESLEMIRAIRGQPNPGLRDFSSTMAWMRASSGPFGPGFFGHRVDENSRRYLHCTKA